MKIMKKLLCVIVLLCMVLVHMPKPAHAANSGSFGNGLKWSISSKGVLTITGTGVMPDFEAWADAPWYSEKDSIQSVTVKKGITGLGRRAFSTLSITGVSLPDGLTSIGPYAFEQCRNLTGIELPSTVKTIGNMAFFACSSIKSIVIPAGVTAIEDYTFSDCMGLESVIIPSTVKTLGVLSFGHCRALTEITIPDSVTSIGQSAFDDCSSLSEVTLSENLTKIERSVFSGCAFTSIEIPDGVTAVESWALSYCEGLKEIILPDSVASVDQTAFSGDSNLKDIYFLGTSAQWKALGLASADINSAKVHYFKSTAVPSLKASLLKEGVTLTWGAVKGADGYQIYRSADGKNFTKKATVKATQLTYTDKSAEIGGTYTYKVRAYHKNKAGDSVMAKFSATSELCYIPNVSTPVISNQRPGLRVSWKAIEGVTGYHVYRKAAGETTFTRIRVISSKYNYITDPDVQSGISYTYKVRAYYKDAAGVTHLGAFSEKKGLRRIGTPAMSLTASTGSVKVAWDAQNGVTGYQVYRKEGTGSYKLVKNTTSLSFTDKKATAGKTYTYKVRAYYTTSSGKDMYGAYCESAAVKAK